MALYKFRVTIISSAPRAALNTTFERALVKANYCLAFSHFAASNPKDYSHIHMHKHKLTRRLLTQKQLVLWLYHTQLSYIRQKLDFLSFMRQTTQKQNWLLWILLLHTTIVIFTWQWLLGLSYHCFWDYVLIQYQCCYINCCCQLWADDCTWWNPQFTATTAVPDMQFGHNSTSGKQWYRQ